MDSNEDGVATASENLRLWCVGVTMSGDVGSSHAAGGTGVSMLPKPGLLTAADLGHATMRTIPTPQTRSVVEHGRMLVAQFDHEEVPI